MFKVYTKKSTLFAEGLLRGALGGIHTLSQRIRCMEIRLSLCLWSCLSSLLSEKFRSLLNTGLEQIVVLHNELNVVNWQVNEHSSDLWCFWSDQLVNEFVEHGTNLIFVVRVLFNDSWENLVGGHDVPLVSCQSM